MDLLTVQILTLLGLLVTCLSFSLLPLAVAWKVASRLSLLNNGRASRFLSYANSFAGGVFFGTCFLELLPHVRHDLEDRLREYGVDTHYPFPEFVTCVGFFIVHLVESLTHRCIPHDHHPSPAPQDVRQARRSDRTVDDHDATRPLISQNSKVTGYNAIIPSAEEGNTARRDRFEDSNNNSSAGKNVPTFLLLIALSFHGAFEGVALGVQATQSSLLSLFTAVIVHKSIIALSLGMNVATSGLSLAYKVVTCIVFAVSGPVGQGIGLAVTDADSDGLVTGILQGVATGTLLHVTFMEVLSKEMKTINLLSMLCAVIGFALIAGLTLLH